MLDKYPKLELIAITYRNDKVEEITERTAIVSNGYFHEIHILCFWERRFREIMNFRETKEANKLINEIENLDRFTIDVQNPARTLKVSTEFNGVILKGEHKIKVIQVIFGIRRELAKELEELGVTEELEND